MKTKVSRGRSIQLSAIAAALLAASGLQAAEKRSLPASENLYVPSWEVGNRGFFTPAALGRGHWLGRARTVSNSEESGWKRLYNGKDLTGWHAKDGKIEAWKANGDMISCVLPGGGWLTSDRTYGDFELKLEYRIPKGGNSGVGIRYPAQGDPAHVGMEIQVLDDAAPEYKNLNPAQYNGGIYYQSAPSRKAQKAVGEWNLYEIRAQGPNIRIKLNGVEIQNINVENFTKGQGGHKALAERPRSGHIGMQSHGHQVDFRNIQIREL